MPIEFTCRQCGRQMRSPDSAAGKKGRCSGCGSIQDIPAATSAPGATPTPATDDGIAFNCPACKELVRTPASAAGKRGKCPHCGGVVEIPHTGTVAASPTPKKESPQSHAAPAQKQTEGSAAQKRPVQKRQRFADGPTQRVTVKAGTIEFPCGACGATMRTPLSAAGKKGRCPSCGQVSAIPTPKPAASAEPKPTESVKNAPQRAGLTELPSKPAVAKPKLTPLADSKPTTGGGIGDGLLTELPDAGSKPTAPAGGSAPKTTSKPPWAKKAASETQTISFACPNCRKQVTTPASTAGKKGQCPHCHQVMPIPKVASAAGPTGPSAGDLLGAASSPTGLEPLDGGLTDLTDLGGPSASLTPLDGGLQELSGTAPAGLTPLGDTSTGGLMPIDGGGLTPLNGGGLAPLDTGGLSPLDGAMMPAAGGAAPRPAKPGGFARYSGPRNGLPWERGEKSTAKYFATAGKVLFSPTAGFGMMKRRGGIGAPLGFAVTGGLLVAALLTLLFALLIGLGLLLGLSAAGASSEQTGFAMGFAVVQILVMLVSMLFSFTVGTIIHTFIVSGILHLLLMAVGGANQSFETTYRVVAYTYGSLLCVMWIPILNIVVLIAYVVLLWIGLAAGHETSGGKAAAAVMLPVGVCCIISAPMLFLFGGGILQALQQMG